jgi:hypothetical protein
MRQPGARSLSQGEGLSPRSEGTLMFPSGAGILAAMAGMHLKGAVLPS